jgi:hypothetical protein
MIGTGLTVRAKMGNGPAQPGVQLVEEACAEHLLANLPITRQDFNLSLTFVCDPSHLCASIRL